MKTQIHPSTKNRYDKFEAISKATELITISDDQNSCEYHKLVQTGELGVHDYGVGFLNFETVAHKTIDYKNNETYWQASIYITTVDDGDFGGISKPLSKAKALSLVRTIAKEVMKDLVVFPTKDRLNAMLRPYGLFVDCE